MQTKSKNHQDTTRYTDLPAAELLSVITDFQHQVESQKADFQQQIQSREDTLKAKDKAIRQRDRYIALLEEQLRLKKAQQFAASSEKLAYQIQLFDEAEMEVET